MNTHLPLSQFAKYLAIAATLSSMLATPAFAADASNSKSQARSEAQVPSHAHQKTRAEVYQALVDAEKSGEMARLNSLYAGG